jgi:hypothetical protein
MKSNKTVLVLNLGQAFRSALSSEWANHMPLKSVGQWFSEDRPSAVWALRLHVLSGITGATETMCTLAIKTT